MRFAKQLLITGAALSATALLSCSIPKPECQVGQTTYLSGWSGNDYAAFAVRYIPKGNVTCPTVFTGEVLGMQSYHPADASDGQVRDFSKTSVAIRTENHGELFFMVEDFEGPEAAALQKPNAEGPFVATDPDETDFCYVNEISEARVTFAGAAFPFSGGFPCVDDVECQEGFHPASTCQVLDSEGNTDCVIPCAADSECQTNVDAYSSCQPTGDLEVSACHIDLPSTDLSYKWSNVQVYVTAAAPGTQFKADVTITLDGCAAEYTAVGMWPAVDCTDYAGTGAASDDFCNPVADPDSGRIIGSGINPDFGPVTCDTSVNVLGQVDTYATYAYLGYPLTVPRCTLATETLPALEGFSGGSGGAGGAGE